MKTLRNTCLLLAVSLAISFCTSRVVAQDADEPAAAEPKSGFYLKLQHVEKWYYEIAFVSFMLVYVINIIIGRAQNEKLAISWTAEMVKVNGVLDRNFSMIGPGDTKAGEVLLKESMNEFKLWASGRRYCQSFLATFILKKRQDLVGLALDLVMGSSGDIMDIEIAMNEASMPPLVLVVATTGVARALQKSMPDVETFTRKLEVERSRLPGWPSKGLVVLGEHSSALYDLMTPAIMELLFGPAAWERTRRLLRSLHISSEYVSGSQKAIIRLSVNLPADGDAEAMTRLLTAVTLLIDIVGAYKLSPEQQKRALEVRAKKSARADEAKEAEEERQRRAEERRLKKLDEEKEKMKRMTPEQRARYEEKKRKSQFKKAFRIKMM